MLTNQTEDSEIRKKCPDYTGNKVIQRDTKLNEQGPILPSEGSRIGSTGKHLLSLTSAPRYNSVYAD